MENIKILKQEPIFPDTQTWFGDCHANTQVKIGSDEYLVAFWAGTSEGTPDQAIWLSRCSKGTWQAPIRLKIYTSFHTGILFCLNMENGFIFFTR